MAKLAQERRRMAELEAENRRLRSLVERLKREASGGMTPAAEGEPRPPRGKR